MKTTKLLIPVAIAFVLVLSLFLLKSDAFKSESVRADAITNYAGRITVDAGAAHTTDWNSTAWTQEGYGAFSVQVTQDVTDAADSVVYTLYRSLDPVGCAQITNWSVAYDTVLVETPGVAASRYISYVSSTPEQTAYRVATIASTPVQLARELAAIYSTPVQDAYRLNSTSSTPLQYAPRLDTVVNDPVVPSQYISYTASGPVVDASYLISTTNDAVVFSRYAISSTNDPLVISQYVSYTTSPTGTNPVTVTYHYADDGTPFAVTYNYGTDSTPWTQTYNYGTNSTPFTQTYGYGTNSTPWTQTYTYGTVTTPFTVTYSYVANTTPFTQTYAYSDNTTPFTQTYAYSTNTTPFTQTYGYQTVAAIAGSVTRVNSAQTFTLVGDTTLNLQFNAGAAWCYRVAGNSTTGRTVTTTIIAAPTDVYQ